MDAAQAPTASPMLRHTVSMRSLIASIFGILAAMQVLLLAFLGVDLLAQIGVAVAFAAVIYVMLRSSVWCQDGVSLRLLAACMAISLLVFVLGGEGRLLYANTDWTVRNAVLRDMVMQPWPFAYDSLNGALILRAPLGMYLVPALVGKGLGFHASEIALLLSNSLLLALVLAIGATLYRETSQRWIAVLVFLGFSGMDILGQAAAERPLTRHLEQWAGMQYTGHLTQLFWVPQHALAGWIFALLYLLWIEARIPRVAMLVAAPMLALLSPLALIGCLPFAAHAGLAGLRDRSLGWRDFALPAAVCALCVPGLAYLTTAGASVGSKFANVKPIHYLVFISLEVLVFLAAAFDMRAKVRFGPVTAAIVIVVLLLLPFGRIGDGADFVMRVSIPALAILALIVADLVMRRPEPDEKTFAKARKCVILVLVIGLVTPASEVARAVLWPRAPEILCSYIGVVPYGDSSYVAPVSALPGLIRPANPVVIRPADPAKCWDGAWPDASTGRETYLENGNLAPEPR